MDTNNLDRKAKQFAEKFPNSRSNQDYRKMLDEVGKDIDAVTVSTPDHNHGTAALRAMKLGKHCFCQKPLVQTVYEARQMRQIAKEKNLATQMGNQVLFFGNICRMRRTSVNVWTSGFWQKQCLPIFIARMAATP